MAGDSVEGNILHQLGNGDSEGLRCVNRRLLNSSATLVLILLKSTFNLSIVIKTQKFKKQTKLGKTHLSLAELICVSSLC